MSLSMLQLLHTSPLDAHFHWEYQALVLLALAGLWLFLAGHAERKRDAGTGKRAGRCTLPDGPMLD